ncbi:spore germination protein [Peribacillus glennii]|uniref:Spore germination protein n=1 Tax=Peribacillus glennii TaxID=2303991 RepID=A0A372LK04_9BACI|nr:spore germination protein [Peribacillus glennii]RFU66765.1 spore germination protein [Peribacillus glennii]
MEQKAAQNGKETITLRDDLQDSVTYLEKFLGQNEDIVFRHFRIFGNFSAFLCYFSEHANPSEINTDILKPLMYPPEHIEKNPPDISNLVEVMIKEVLYQSKVKTITDWEVLIEGLFQGDTIMLIDGVNSGLKIGTRKLKERSIDEPRTELVVLGPREGFIEQLGTNIGLLRYRLPTSDLVIKTMKIGKFTKTKVAVCYIKSVTDPELIKEVEDRLSKIEFDSVLDSGIIEQFIEDNPYSPFPQIQTTERPDRTVGNLIEGRVAILTQGSPFALILPTVFNQFYQTTEDYTNRFLMGNFIRMIRILALVFSLIFPSMYVSFIAFNPELLPTEFAVAVSGGRAGVPFPAVIEVLVIEVAMEILREATVRLPQQVGGALSIVGVLIIGQAAVEAGFASPVTVVVIAIATIGSFATPVYTAAFALRMLRFPILILAGTFGLYGVVIGAILIFNHMLSLKSFGVPYMSPVSPPDKEGMKDVVVRSPLWKMKSRPRFLQPQDIDRVGAKTQDLRDRRRVPGPFDDSN